jgi:chemotaxis response regulator CheB
MMPQSAIQMAGADEILRLEEIASYLERRFAPRGPVAENALEEPNEAG